jgi:8-oxo-dGTP diphosphatase
LWNYENFDKGMGNVMKMIRKITDSDIFGGTSELMDTVSRFASRGVLIDDQMNVAMMYMSETNLYKLPGGGIEEGETREESYLREIKEETGHEAEILYDLGYIEEHKKRNDFMQFSFCYIAKARRRVSAANLSESELQLGMAVNWMTLDKALEVMNESLTNCNDYSTRFMILRDNTILEIAIKILKESENEKIG